MNLQKNHLEAEKKRNRRVEKKAWKMKMEILATVATICISIIHLLGLLLKPDDRQRNGKLLK